MCCKSVSLTQAHAKVDNPLGSGMSSSGAWAKNVLDTVLSSVAKSGMPAKHGHTDCKKSAAAGAEANPESAGVSVGAGPTPSGMARKKAPKNPLTTSTPIMVPTTCMIYKGFQTIHLYIGRVDSSVQQ